MACRSWYSLMNSRDDWAAERCFTPWPDMEQKLRSLGLPLYSLETFTPLSHFDVVGFSLQYEMSSPNVLTMSHLGGIPLCVCEVAARWPIRLFCSSRSLRWQT